ncbi:MAG: hypothetical protein AAF465_05950 [Pseudomonadota bacterium]
MFSSNHVYLLVVVIVFFALSADGKVEIQAITAPAAAHVESSADWQDGSGVVVRLSVKWLGYEQPVMWLDIKVVPLSHPDVCDAPIGLYWCVTAPRLSLSRCGVLSNRAHTLENLDSCTL